MNTKVNYLIHTDAIKENLIPPDLQKSKTVQRSQVPVLYSNRLWIIVKEEQDEC